MKVLLKQKVRSAREKVLETIRENASIRHLLLAYIHTHRQEGERERDKKKMERIATKHNKNYE